MLNKDTSSTPVVSETEQAALSAENRRAKAEGEFVILLEDKKRVSADMEKIQVDIQTGKKTIEENNEQINKTNNDILTVQSELRSERQILTDFLKESETKKSEVECEIKKKEEEKSVITSDITYLSQKYDLDVFNNGQEIKKLEAQKDVLNSDINRLQVLKTSVATDIETAKQSLEVLTEALAKLNEEKTALDSTLNSIKNDIEVQKGFIANNKTVIAQQETKIADQQVEISDWEKKISVKKEEYDGLVASAFSILKKQQSLDNKEEFIKSKYELAGIKWED